MVVIVLSDYGHVNGGAAQVAIRGLNALADSGHKIIFVSAVGPVDEAIDRSKVETINFGLHDLLDNPSRISAAVRGIWDWDCARKLRTVLEQCDNADSIVHVHSWSKSFSSSVIHESVKMGFEVVCTLHDYFTVCPNGALFDFQKNEICHLKPLSFLCLTSHCDARSYSHKLWRVVRQFAQNEIAGLPESIRHYIAVSEASAKIMRPNLGKMSQVHFVRNPIDVPRAQMATPASNEGFLFVGRFSPEKGAALFAQAAGKAGASARFAGKGEGQVQILEANPNSVMLGWLGKDEVQQEIRSCRALVFPSLWYETQGLVVQEAAAHGIPVVVSDSCVARDSIVDGETGLLFRAGDSDDLAEKIRFLNEDAEFAGRMGRAAYHRFWADPPTLDNHVDELLACYQSILSARVA